MVGLEQVTREFFDQAEKRGIFVDFVPAEAHCTWCKSHHARILRMMGNRTLEDLDIDGADVQQLLDELTDAKDNLVEHNRCLPRHYVLGSSPRIPGHDLEENSDLPLLENVGWQRLRWKRTRRSERAHLEGPAE